METKEKILNEKNRKRRKLHAIAGMAIGISSLAVGIGGGLLYGASCNDSTAGYVKPVSDTGYENCNTYYQTLIYIKWVQSQEAKGIWDINPANFPGSGAYPPYSGPAECASSFIYIPGYQGCGGSASGYNCTVTGNSSYQGEQASWAGCNINMTQANGAYGSCMPEPNPTPFTVSGVGGANVTKCTPD